MITDKKLTDLINAVKEDDVSVVGGEANFWKDIYDCLNELLYLRQQQEFEMYLSLLKRVDALMNAGSDEEQEDVSVVGGEANFWRDIYDCLNELLYLRRGE